MRLRSHSEKSTESGGRPLRVEEAASVARGGTERERQPRWRRKNKCEKYCRDFSCRGSALPRWREREVMIEETRAQTAEIERSALIQTLVTMRQERGGAMLKNGKGKGKPNSAEKVSSQSVLLEDRHTVKVTAPESGAAVTW